MADWEREGATRTPGAASRDSRDTQHSTMSTIGRATESVREAAEEAGRSVRETAADLKRSALEEVESRKEDLAERVEGVAESVRRSAGDLRDREGWLAELVERGSEELSNFAEIVRTKNVGDLTTYLEDFAQRQPALFAGASIAIGFALARFVKASGASVPSSGGEQAYWSNRGSRPQGYAGAVRHSAGSSSSYGASQAGSQSNFGGGAGSGSHTDDNAASGSGAENAPPRGTELGAHVAGPELERNPYRERTGATSSVVGAGHSGGSVR